MSWFPSEPAPLDDAEIRPLLNQLQRESLEDRLSALDLLTKAKLPGDAFELADRVMSLLESDADAEVRTKAVEILAKSFARTAKYTKAVFAALNDDSESFRKHVAQLFTYLPSEPVYVPEYLGALRNSDADVRGAAIYRLQYGPFDRAITEEIIATLSEQDHRIRIRAVEALALICRQSKEQVDLIRPALIGVLCAPEHAIAFTAAKTLRSIDEDNAEADRVFDKFMEADLHSDDGNNRHRGLWELSNSPKGGEKYVDRLSALLDGNDGDLYNAAAALEKIGPPAHAAIPHLKRHLFKKTRVLEISKALAAVGARDQEIIEWLARQALASYPHAVGSIHCAARGLAHFGKDAVPFLIKGVEWDNGIVQSSTCEALGFIGKDAAAAVPHMLRVLEYGGGQPNQPTCGAEAFSELLEALVKIAPEDENVINRIRAIAQDGNDGRCLVAIRALKAIGIKLPVPANMVPYHVRHDPCAPKAKPTAHIPAASQALLNALTDPDEKVRLAAASSMPPAVVRKFLINLCTSPGRARDIALHSLEFLDQNDLAPTLLRTLPTGGLDDAVTVIERIGNDALAAVAPLLRQVHGGHAMFKLKPDEQFGYRSEVLDALAKFGPDDERVLECLASLTGSRHEHFQSVNCHMAKAAIAALASIGSERAMAIIRESERSQA